MRKHSVSRWIVLCFTCVFLFSLALSSVANYLENRKNVSERADDGAARLLEMVRIVLEDEKNFKGMAASAESEEYRQVENAMLFLSGVYEVSRLDLYRIDPDTQERSVLLSVRPDDGPEEDGKSVRDSILSGKPLQPVERQWLEGEEYVYSSFRERNSTLWIMGGRSLKSGTGYLAAADFDLIVQDRAILSGFLWNIIPNGLALLLGLVILLILVRRRIIRPIGMISDSMKQFSGDGSRKPEPLSLQSRDEIGEIAASYTKMTEDISSYVNSIEALTKEKLETGVELEVARRIQDGLVPGKTSLKGDGFDACAMTQPARAVGGDFYECFLRDEQSVCVVMGDVSGKGISAAIFMAMAKTIIREKLMAGLSPAQALNQANEELCRQNPEGLFATVFAAVLDPRTGEVRYANAGHTRPVLLGETPVLLTPDPGVVLGLFTDADIRSETLRLGAREGILLYTDGVTEAVNTENRFFGEQRLLDALSAMPRGTDAGEVLLGVSRAVAAFCGGREPFDDMAGLALFHIPAEHSRKKIPVALSSFGEIKKDVFEAAGDTPKTRKALLACDEALANIVSYSGATDLYFSCEREENELRITLSDNGIPFDPTKVQPEEKEFELLKNGGMGISMIRQTVSGTHYERRQDRNEFEMRFLLQDDPGTTPGAASAEEG